jgi:uncharacterized protein HemX
MDNITPSSSDQMPHATSIETQPAELPVYASTATTSGGYTPAPEGSASSRLMVLLIIIAVALIAALGWYIWGSTSSLKKIDIESTQNQVATDTTPVSGIQSTDPEINDLSSALDAAITSDSEADLQRIDAEF